MELYLQFGYGMMGHCRHLIKSWQSGTVILSPRDQEIGQISDFVPDIHKAGGQVVFDPQFYVPHADHGRLTSHSFWPNDYSTALFNSTEVRKMLTVLRDEYNTPFETSFFILPGNRSSEINDDWYKYHSIIIKEAQDLDVHDNIYFTLCLSKEAMNSEDTIHNVLEYLDTWDIQGCYVVPEPSNNSYLVDNPNWLVNLMDLTAGIKLQNKKVVVGYANHQMLNLALTKTDAIASGNWINVRSFNASKFNNPDDSVSRRSTWYYCPQSLSEYQIPILDMAKRLSILDDLRTDTENLSGYADILFSGAQPTTVQYSERESFRHYLQCLHMQAQNAVKGTYAETRESIKLRLETAERLTKYFNDNGIRGKDRDFIDVVDSNLSALNVFHRLRGMILGHKWDTI
ncbi:MAG: hypothetical protein JJ876_11640 [Muricauda sp.]|nr:hypothetical protein [Allomuricauda sp.]MBO6830198.1 hypothetical protein [Allomuricauda sp.]